jgi:hypothetical protein
MPRGASPKRERQYEHIKQSAKKSGRYGRRAEEVAARTVNKIRREKGEAKSQRSRAKTPSTRSTSSKRPRRGKGRGFAGMSEHRQRAIAAEGGRAAHERGTAHEFSVAEARKAGQKGGVTVSRDRSHMARIGRKGGER